MCISFLFFKFTPILFATNKLASQYLNSSEIIDCNKNVIEEVCKQASKDSLLIYSYEEGISFLLMFILSPTLGRLSDSYGRKPFLYYCSISMGLWMILFYYSIRYDLNIYYWIVLSIPVNIVSYSTIILMMISDNTPVTYRASIFGLLFVFLYILVPIVSLLIGIIGLYFCFYIMYISTFLEIILVLFSGETLYNKIPVVSLNVLNPFRNISIIFRNNNLIGLSITLFIFSFVNNGIFDVMRVYTIQKLNFSYLDYTIFLTITCISSLAVSIPNVIQYLLGKYGYKYLLIYVLIVGILIHLLIPLTNNKILFLILSFINGVSTLVITLVFALKSNLVEEHEQGKIQGVMGGIQSIANGLAPIVFSYLLKTIDTNAPFYFYSIIQIICLIIVIFLLDLRESDSKFIDDYNSKSIKYIISIESEKEIL